MTNVLNDLTLPFKMESGQIVDGTGKPVIKANRESGKTPLAPAGQDALLFLVADLLNEAFQYDKANSILQKHGY